MRYAILCSVAGFVLSMGRPVAAQEFKLPPFFAPQTKPAPRPTVDWNWRPAAASASPDKPEVVCGMTVIPADPAVDPKMRVAPSDRGTAFTMRVVPPTICAPK
jgi:hypothetical protein